MGIMDKQDAIREIIRLWEDPNGFLVQLRGSMVFNEHLYRKIMEALSGYYDLVAGDENINRRVARFLCDLAITLEGEAYQFSLRKHPDAQKVSIAHAQTLELLYKLLP
jgi:hypothetical protein